MTRTRRIPTLSSPVVPITVAGTLPEGGAVPVAMPTTSAPDSATTAVPTC
jgi:hypothetical protein